MREIQRVLTLVTAPTTYPISLSETKTALKLGASTSEDALVDGWIASAVSMFEEWTGRQIMPARWSLWLDDVPSASEIELPKAPLLEVTSIDYLDAEVVTTFDAANYTVMAPRGDRAVPGRVRLVSGASWPTTQLETMGALRIHFDAGYADLSTSPFTAAVPDLVKAALFMLVDHLYHFRGPVQESRSLVEVPLHLKLILDGFKYSALPTQGPLWTV